MRVLITGATGFIGRALCPALVATGHEVAAVVRNSGNPGIPERATVHVIPDIGPETEWDQPLSGMDAEDQFLIDRTMIELDGTPDKSSLGANAVLAVSLAVAKASALYISSTLRRMLSNMGNYTG